MSPTPKQWRVIKWFMDKEHVIPQLSAYPTVRFLTKDAEIVEHNIRDLADWYDADLKQQARDRAAARRRKKA